MKISSSFKLPEMRFDGFSKKNPGYMSTSDDPHLVGTFIFKRKVKTSKDLYLELFKISPEYFKRIILVSFVKISFL